MVTAAWAEEPGNVEEALTNDHPHLHWRVHPGLHAKVILIDRTLAIFGSANLTARAWKTNLEYVLASIDPSTLAAAQRQFDAIWSTAVSVEDCVKAWRREKAQSTDRPKKH